MKLTNVTKSTTAAEPFEFHKSTIVDIVAPISQAIEWHKLTKWRSAAQLRAQYPALWETWKKENKIPERVILSVESGQNESKPFSL